MGSDAEKRRTSIENQLHDNRGFKIFVNFLVKLTSRNQQLPIGTNLPAFKNNRIKCSGKLSEKSLATLLMMNA